MNSLARLLMSIMQPVRQGDLSATRQLFDAIENAELAGSIRDDSYMSRVLLNEALHLWQLNCHQHVMIWVLKTAELRDPLSGDACEYKGLTDHYEQMIAWWRGRAAIHRAIRAAPFLD